MDGGAQAMELTGGTNSVILYRRMPQTIGFVVWILLPALAASLSVKLPSGDYVRGERFNSSAASGTVFAGIRYALPQGSHNRFKPAEPFVSSAGGPSIQFSNTLPTCGTDNTTTFREDCLYLSVWRPRGSMVANTPSRPVMVHIHPGALHKMSPTSSKYDWMHWATQTGSIVVGMSFRLGIFGHFASEELAAEQNGRVGNLGFLDQRLALEWIRRNIGAFGGNASQVTLFGLSSGALACVWHAASPASTGLFHACIAESGPGGENYYQAKPDAFRFWQWVSATFFSCSSLACLRGADAAALNLFIGNTSLGLPDWAPGTFPAFPYGGVMDGVDIPAYPLTMARDGACTDTGGAGGARGGGLNCSLGRIPVILSSTAEECHSFLDRVVRFVPTLAPWTDTRGSLFFAIGKQHAAAFADWFAGWRRDDDVMRLACDLYPASLYGGGGALLGYMYRDQRYTCPQLRMRAAWSRRGAAAPAYFLFNQRGKRQGRIAMHGWLYEGVFEFSPRAYEILCYYAGMLHHGDPNSRPNVPACLPAEEARKRHFQPLPSSLDDEEGQLSYLLIPQHDHTPLKIFKLPQHHTERTSERDPPSMDICEAWEAWHGASKPLFLPHAELHKDTRMRQCNGTDTQADNTEL